MRSKRSERAVVYIYRTKQEASKAFSASRKVGRKTGKATLQGSPFEVCKKLVPPKGKKK